MVLVLLNTDLSPIVKHTTIPSIGLQQFDVRAVRHNTFDIRQGVLSIAAVTNKYLEATGARQRMKQTQQM
jgi:hypothetical protein